MSLSSVFFCSMWYAILLSGGVIMNEAFEVIKTGVQFFFQHLVVFNMLFAIVIVFFQRRDPKSVWAWLLLLYFIPVLGFVFYLLLGQDMHKRKMFRIKEVEDHISEDIRQQEYRLKTWSCTIWRRESLY